MYNARLVYNEKIGCSQFNTDRNRTERSTRNNLPKCGLAKEHDKNNIRSNYYMTVPK